MRPQPVMGLSQMGSLLYSDSNGRGRGVWDRQFPAKTFGVLEYLLDPTGLDNLASY